AVAAQGDVLGVGVGIGGHGAGLGTTLAAANNPAARNVTRLRDRRRSDVIPTPLVRLRSHY
ncbi:hypothetical protein ACWD4N_34255, partial [Streptomyces sp. NPDC002586]